MSASFLSNCAQRAMDTRYAQLRKQFSATGLLGPHPLDADSLDLALFAVGWELLLRDLRIGLTPEQSQLVEKLLVTNGMRRAFVVRANLVNYKKVLLGIYRSSVTLSHDLRRLAAFFREPPAEFADDDDSSERHRGFFRPTRYRELSDALCTTDGTVGGLLDARRFCKAVCCVPRHPDAPRTTARPYGQPFSHYRCAGLLSEPLPASMKSWRMLQGASGCLSAHAQLHAQLDEVLAPRAAKIALLPAEATNGFDALLDRLRSLRLPPADEWYVRCVLIARGGAKALAVAAETRRLADAMRVVLEACEDAEAMLEAEGGAEPPRDAWASELQKRSDVAPSHADSHIAVAAAAAAAPPPAAAAAADAQPLRWGHPAIKLWVLARKQACTLAGLRASLSSTAHWLGEIASEGELVLFVGTDGDWSRGTTSFAPASFALPRIFEQARTIVDSRSVELVTRLETHGWPRWIAAAAGTSAAASGGRASSKRATQPCAHCGQLFSSVWVRERVCLGCETRVRREGDTGRCPFGGIGGCAQCGPAAWCPHDRRCFACDGWSCSVCRFYQGDGSDVADLVASLQPAHVFLDFDRTLCSTKGGSPLTGTHSVDDDLLELCATMAGRAHVVTRNAHVDDIRVFLAQKGVVDVPVHRVSKACSKAIILSDAKWTARGSHEQDEQGQEVGDRRGDASDAIVSPVVLFVDDTLTEHLNPDVSEAKHIVRFLFARSAR